MIRRPITRSQRLGLGAASLLLLAVAYTWLANSRQTAARREQGQSAAHRVADLEQRLAKLQQRRAEIDGISDAARQTRELNRWQAEAGRLAKSLADARRQQSQPDALDLTVPNWSLLWRQGLLRAVMPQGSFERKEIWLWLDLRASLARLAAALVLGAAISVATGLCMGCYDPVDALLMPPLSLAAKVPATAVLPIFFVLVQINFTMYVAIIVFSMLPTLAQTISASVRKDIPEELVYKALTLGASPIELVWNVVWKQVLPRVLDAFRLQLGPALVLLVAAEWMVAGEGVGYRLRLFYQRTDMTIVFVYVAILGVLGLAVDYSLIWLRRRLCPWFGD